MIKTMLAIGGNSFQPVSKNKESFADIKTQIEALSPIAHQLVSILHDCNQTHAHDERQLVITHGNGPQVGILMQRSELSKHSIDKGGVGYPVPLDILDADTQGSIGYMLFVAYWAAISKMGYDPAKFPKLVTLITPVRVDHKDPAFGNPVKPVGLGYATEEEAKAAMASESWDGYAYYAQTDRWRRVVPSPFPEEIESMDAIRTLFDTGRFLLVCAGGGGIPFSRDKNGTIKTEGAVIDKDIASARCAVELGIDEFVICTSVEHVKLDYRKPTERDIISMATDDLKRILDEDKQQNADYRQFAPGQMEPKLEAILYFLTRSTKPDVCAMITSVDKTHAALLNKTNCTIFGNRVKTIIQDKN